MIDRYNTICTLTDKTAVINVCGIPKVDTGGNLLEGMTKISGGYLLSLMGPIEQNRLIWSFKIHVTINH